MYDLNVDSEAFSKKSKGAEIDLTQPAVPFTIIPGHHGGQIAGMMVDEKHKFLVSISGTRGWEATSTQQALFYNITPKE